MSESASGEADSSTADSGKEFSCPVCEREYASASGIKYHMKSCCPDELVACPECERLFKNETGMKQHANQTHNLDLTSATKECPQCKEEFEYRTYTERKYCSRECAGEARAEHYADKRIDVECIYCGDVVSLAPCFAERRKYCSHSCRGKDLTEKGIINPNPEKEYISFNCKYCGEEYEVVPAESDNTAFCSKQCQGKWRTGSRNPNWRGGRVDHYGPNWSEQRSKALKRDEHKCQGCGIERDELDRDLSVHHIQPLRKFKKQFDEPDWWKKGNELENLVTFCRPCHMRWEGIPLRPY